MLGRLICTAGKVSGRARGRASGAGPSSSNPPAIGRSADGAFRHSDLRCGNIWEGFRLGPVSPDLPFFIRSCPRFPKLLLRCL